MFQHRIVSMENDKFSKIGSTCGNIFLPLTNEGLPRHYNFDPFSSLVIHSIGDFNLTSAQQTFALFGTRAYGWFDPACGR